MIFHAIYKGAQKLCEWACIDVWFIQLVIKYKTICKVTWLLFYLFSRQKRMYFLLEVTCYCLPHFMTLIFNFFLCRQFAKKFNVESETFSTKSARCRSSIRRDTNESRHSSRRHRRQRRMSPRRRRRMSPSWISTLKTREKLFSKSCSNLTINLYKLFR